mmetsp:Transcript_32829/g.60515  ORF Transcript_32829/g.60515 Transcript_32829/m.60515 type:complete len:460 (-) Transcript_32829:148-1527(-)|eukprot:CAMPEP_0196140750 /NCGR_PEP_ID=MMETSP0910-20130528/7546_1 /TAXON_ID=49265 /ORGANISM="Thalassiosira rotula, Strain GSO102" /LENGTH=459 /DNA_ID=CAMNT_0041401653 /DNA_START=70 /DNA_END=1449 /DNA_ORIENTATION=+
MKLTNNVQSPVMKWATLVILCAVSFGSIYFTTNLSDSFYSTTKNGLMLESTKYDASSIYEPVHNMDPPVEEEPIHILITVCNGGNNAQEVQSMVRYHEAVDLLITIQRYGMRKSSFADDDDDCSTNNSTDVVASSSCDETIIVHIFTDDAAMLSELFLQQSPTSELIDRLDIRVYNMPTRESVTHDYNKYRSCASARLYAPHLFESIAKGRRNNESDVDVSVILPERVLYLDTDTLATAKLRPLWETSTTMFDSNPDALFAMSQVCILRWEMGPYFHRGYAGENVTQSDNMTELVYTVPNGTCAGYNSGVLFAHLHRWQRRNFTRMVSEQELHATNHNYVMPFGDNGILNAMGARYPERLLELPCYWNMRIESLNACYKEYMGNGGGVLHMQHKNRGKFLKGGKLSVGSLLHGYLVRVNDSGRVEKYGHMLEEYDKEGLDNVMFADILLNMIVNDTRMD